MTSISAQSTALQYDFRTGLVGTPKPLLEHIVADGSRVVNELALRGKHVTAAGLEAMNAGPDTFAELVRADRASCAQRLKALANVRID